MKKLYACMFILLAGAVSLWADLPLWTELSPRKFELGFSAGAGFANSYIGMTEIFKKTIEIDLTQEPKPLFFDFGAGFNFFVNFNIEDKINKKDSMGFGIFMNADALGQLSISEQLLKLLQGNELDKTYEGDIGIGAAAFEEAGAHGYFHIKKFRIAARLAHYFPLVYMEPNTHYTIRTGSAGDAYVDFEYDLALYTLFDLGDPGGDLGSVMNNIKPNPSKLSGQGGLDLTLGVNYPILSQLAVGAVITHIPLFPAGLTHKAVIKGGKRLESADILGELMEGEGLGGLLKDKTVESSHDDIQIFRPFKFGINAVYTPFKKNSFFSLSIIPQIGYAYNAIYVNPHSCEGSLTVRTGLFNIMRSNSLLAFTLSSGYEDKVWRQGVGVTLNFRAMQIDLGVASQSEDFVKSFMAAGLKVNVGLCFGW
jgi:hypothetical protein